MEKIIEIINKYVDKKISEKNFISHIKKQFRKKEFTYQELSEIVSYLKSISQKRLIDTFIVFYIEDHIVEMNFDKIVSLLDELEVELSKTMIIKLIAKGFINKDNVEKISKTYIEALNYYKILNEKIDIDYNYILRTYAEKGIMNTGKDNVLNDYTELKMLVDFKYNKNRKALDCLVMHNVGLIHSVLNQLMNKVSINSEDYEYFFNAGIEGLIKGIDKYDIHSGNKLSTIARYYIVDSVTRAYSKDRTIALPVDLLESPNSIDRLNEADKQSFLNASEKMLSLDDTFSDSDDSEEFYNTVSSENIPNSNDVSLDDLVTEDYNNYQIWKLLKETLSAKDFDIIYSYFYEGLRLEDIAQKYNVSTSAIGDKKTRIIKKLRNLDDLKKLVDLSEYDSANIVDEKEDAQEPVKEDNEIPFNPKSDRLLFFINKIDKRIDGIFLKSKMDKIKEYYEDGSRLNVVDLDWKNKNALQLFNELFDSIKDKGVDSNGRVKRIK